ncbi:MAG: hypothetical protein LAO79_12995 [Acidobacteriia bacterium]|nr:hypothetical protein [Terriglobia bacterium]
MTLGVLGLVLVVVYVLNRTPSSPGPSSAPRAATAADPATPKMPVIARRPVNRNATGRGEDFHPTLKVPEGMDVSKIDPTIKLELLAKVRNVGAEAGSRGSVFAFGTAPPPPAPKVDPIKISKLTAAAAATAALKAAESAKSVEPPKPQAPPIPLKFFGYSNQRTGVKRAFFLDGDDIDVVNENDVIKNRYKVIRIGINSVVVEDLNFKSQQTLPLVEELAG